MDSQSKSDVLRYTVHWTETPIQHTDMNGWSLNYEFNNAIESVWEANPTRWHERMGIENLKKYEFNNGMDFSSKTDGLRSYIAT